MVTAVGLPFLMINGKFQSLNSMTVEDLESFIPFLVHCSIHKAGAELINGVPVWWPSNTRCKFPLKKPSGLSQIGYRRHLSSIVCSCYWYHDAQYLLPFCAKIASSPVTVSIKSIENEECQTKPKKDKSSTRSLLSALPKKPVVIPDIYLCDNCDAEFSSHSDMRNHEKECYKVSVNNKKEGCGVKKRNSLKKNHDTGTRQTEEESDEIEVIAHFKNEDNATIGKNSFLNYLKLKSNTSDENRPQNKSRLQCMSSDLCFQKYRNIEFSSLIGRKMLENKSNNKEFINKIKRMSLINEYYCGTHNSAHSMNRIYREFREPVDFKVTTKRPKRDIWTHQYAFNKEQRRSRCITIRTGLNARSRKLLKQCKRLQIVLNRIDVVL